MIGGCVNWALMVNMTMYTCLPKRRSTANAVQMFTGHILGKSAKKSIRKKKSEIKSETDLLVSDFSRTLELS